MHFSSKLFGALTLLAGISLPAACTVTPGTPTGDAGTDSGTCSGEVKLAIDISGLPAGVVASVAVAGGATSQTVTATSTIVLPAGEYTITPKVVAEPDSIVRKAYNATATTERTCTGGVAQIKSIVKYTLIPSSNKLWAANQQKDETLLGFGPSSLGASGSPAAAVAAKVAGGGKAFDHEGNLWVANGSSLERIPASALGEGGSKTADVIISSSVFEGGVPAVDAMAFDGKGNLWLTIKFSGKIVKIAAADLTASGARTPSVVLTGYKGPTAIAFDNDGNLFVVGDSGLQKFAAAHLEASSDMAGDAKIEALTPSPVIAALSGATGLAFDANKNLWIAYGATLARIEPADLADGTRSITPAVQVTTEVLSLPEQLAFDEAGSVWFAYSAGKFAAYTKDQLTSSGTKVPAVIVSSSNTGYATDVMFYPAPATSPLYASVK